MDYTAVVSGIVGAICLALLSWLIVRTNRVPRRVGGRTVLRYGPLPRVFVVLLGALLPILIISAYIDGRADVSALVFVLVLDAAFLGYLVPEFYLIRIEFDTDYVFTYSPWRKPRIIPWRDFTGREYSSLMYWNTFTTRGFGSVRVHDWLEGAGEFRRNFDLHSFAS